MIKRTKKSRLECLTSVIKTKDVNLHLLEMTNKMVERAKSNLALIDLNKIIEEAWVAYDHSRSTVSITDISAMVSTNHVYKVVISDGSFVIAKLSYFGKHEHFVEDHTIISVLSNNLPAPFDNFLARSLMKGSRLFVHRFTNDVIDAWVVFYLPVRISKKLPRRLDDKMIKRLGSEAAKFHLTCSNLRHTLPPSSKTLKIDIEQLLSVLKTDIGKYEHRMNMSTIQRQCDLFLNNMEKLVDDSFQSIPVFVDWNIGNFSITPSGKFFSRWDYDWFRMSTRIMDFYFFSRVSSDVGDRTAFTYHAGPLMEERFTIFLKSYHRVFPLSENEIRFLVEAYRFFLLNYVIKDGRYFFHEIYATKLQKEVFDLHFPSIEKLFDVEKLLRALKI